jgi:ferredoxin
LTEVCHIKFLLVGAEAVEVSTAPNTKVLAAANKNKIPIRFGCASCRCGTCAVAVELGANGEVKPMQADEKALLTRMRLATDGSVRLACQTRILAGKIAIDLAFQDTYSPDQGDE